MITLQVVLFCLYLKWQPYHTRLHTPLFMLSAPLICYAISANDKYIKMLYRIIPIIIFSALLVILVNSTRPFLSIGHRITSEISITDSRYKKYFANRLNLYEEYNAIREDISSIKNKNISLILGDDDWEYPLFSQFYGREINPIHINVANITKTIPINLNNIDCIISTKKNDAAIDFNGKRFYNQYRKNEIIWLYK